MKKTLVAAGIAAAMAWGNASASQLIVNGEAIPDVQVSSFSYESGVLRLKTNVNLVVEGNETPEPPETDPPETDPPETDPPVTEGCNGEGIVCTNELDWKSHETRGVVVIPKGVTLVTPFTTTSGDHFDGRVAFQNQGSDRHDVWISLKAGVEADREINKALYEVGYNKYYCAQKNKGGTYGINWAQYDNPSVCSLKPGTQYYLNIRNVDKNARSSETWRSRNNNSRP